MAPAANRAFRRNLARLPRRPSPSLFISARLKQEYHLLSTACLSQAHHGSPIPR